MATLKRGCLELIVIWALASFGLYSFFNGKFEPPGDIWGAVAGGMLISWAWGLSRNIYYAKVRLRLLQQAKRGMMPSDGKLFAAAGPIRPLLDPLRTPFQQTECVVYGYELFAERKVRTGSGRSSSTHNVKNTYMGGYGLCPSAVQTSVGSIKILGFPFPDTFPENSFSIQGRKNQVLDYISRTRFDQREGVGIKAILSELKNVLAEDDGSHRYDWRTEHLEERLEDPDLKAKEQCIPVGAEVCLIGPYSAAKGGLTNDLAHGGLEVFSGDLNAGIRAMRARVVGYFSFAIIFALGGTFGSYGVLTARELRDPKVVELNSNRLAEAIKTNDLNKARTALEHGAAKSFSNPNFDPVISELSSVEMIRLLMEFGFDVNKPLNNDHPPLVLAAEKENASLVSALLEAGADPNVRQSGWGTTALEKAFDSRNEEIIAVLQGKNARGIFVSPTTGRPLSGSLKEKFFKIILDYYSAHNAENAEKVRELTDGWPEDFFESFGRGLYSGTRVCQPRFEKGFVSDHAATLFVTCPTGHGPELWVYTLVERNGSWKIRRESWDEKSRWAD